MLLSWLSSPVGQVRFTRAALRVSSHHVRSVLPQSNASSTPLSSCISTNGNEHAAHSNQCVTATRLGQHKAQSRCPTARCAPRGPSLLLAAATASGVMVLFHISLRNPRLLGAAFIPDAEPDGSAPCA